MKSFIRITPLFALGAIGLSAVQLAAQDDRMHRAMMRGNPAFIQVSGEGVVELPADLARISFTVETEAPEAASASRDNANRMDAVIRALRGTDIDGLEIETFGYSLQPVYDRPRDGSAPQIARFRAMNNVRVTIPDVDRVGEVLDAGIGAGANRIAGLQFDASDTREAQREAVRRAVEAARTEAEVMANALGFQLGRPMEVNGGAQGGPVPMFRTMEMVQDQASTPIEPGGRTVRASVSIKFAIGRPLSGSNGSN